MILGEVSILDTTSFHVDRSYRNYENEAEHPDQYLGKEGFAKIYKINKEIKYYNYQ